MKRKPIKPYFELPIIPAMVAEMVASRPYTGAEWSDKYRYRAEVERIESSRQALTPEEVRAFSDACERFCHDAYDAGAEWFIKIALASGDQGRDQLSIWVAHWLSSYVTDKAQFLARWQRKKAVAA